MKILDRYIVKHILISSFISISLSLTLLLAMQALRLSGLIIKNSLGLGILFKMLEGLSLSFTPIIFPIAFLFTLLFVFGKLSTDRELIAMQAMGHSPFRIMKPALWAGVLMFAMTLWCSLYWAPYGNRLFEVSIDEALSKKITTVLRPGTFTENFLDLVLYVEDIDKENDTLKGVFIYDEENVEEGLVITAESGKWIAANDDGWASLLLKNGVIFSQNEEKDILRRIKFDEYKLNADFASKVGRSKDSPASQSWSDLVKKRNELNNQSKIDPRPIWVEFARRIAISFACFLFVPISFILSINNQRTAQSRFVLTGFIILVLYWTLYFSLVSWVSSSKFELFRHELIIWFFIWIPNFILLYLNISLYRKKFLSLRH